jgi:hypothetical protein
VTFIIERLFKSWLSKKKTIFYVVHK